MKIKRKKRRENVRRIIELEEAVGQYRNAKHCSHIMLYARDVFENTEAVFALMQKRTDGITGFPGGKSDEKSVDQVEIVKSLYRELHEEIYFTPEDGQITIQDLMSSLYERDSKDRVKIRHFFAKEIPLDTFQWIEKNYTSAPHFPKETLGVFRVPLRAIGERHFKIVPKFFKHFENFMSKTQFIDCVIKLDLIGEKDRKKIEMFQNYSSKE